MWRNFKSTAPKHDAHCKRAFSNLDKTCKRCVELANGAKAYVAPLTNDQRRCNEIAAHSKVCSVERCGIVCTHGEW